MNNHGGKREGAGRKPKEDREDLVNRLTPYDDLVFQQMEEGIKSGQFKWIKLFMEYRYGKTIPMPPAEESAESKSIKIIYQKPSID